MITTLSPDLTTPVPEALIQRLNLSTRLSTGLAGGYFR
jgi:hypothetical protein